MEIINSIKNNELLFIDLFSGCGGLSLGLVNAGWKGLFAIEIHSDAFNTFKKNLLEKDIKFNWPSWLPKKNHDIKDFICDFNEHLKSLKGKIDLIAGGPPCQGFSLAGRRTHSDPRNSLIKDYLTVVNLIEPRFLLIENVIGFTQPFKKNNEILSGPYSKKIQVRLESMGYKVFSQIINFNKFGVPQNRSRFILIGIKNNDLVLDRLNGATPFSLLFNERENFLYNKGLFSNRPITVKEAIGDLEVNNSNLIDCLDSNISGFKQIDYTYPTNNSSPYIKLLKSEKAPNSMRLANHKESTILQFEKILNTCELGKAINNNDRERLGIKKRAITPLKASSPSATITTLPDDIIHYSEPRILTVRENARLQSFPDWFEFTGSYTTGGQIRKSDCPRYTQVGNAVPPLFAEALGNILYRLGKLNNL